MTWFNKYYRCPCGHEWQDEWDCLCDDRCPKCDTSCEPYDHAEIDETAEDKAMHDALLYGTGVIVHNYPLQSYNIPFIMFIKKDATNEDSGSKPADTFLSDPHGIDGLSVYSPVSNDPGADHD